MQWANFENGNTIGRSGSESGVTLRDSEHPLGARITLESAGSVAPYSITCAIYGSMVHTRFFATEQAANQQFELMASAIATILQTATTDDAMIDSIEQFVEDFP